MTALLLKFIAVLRASGPVSVTSVEGRNRFPLNADD